MRVKIICREEFQQPSTNYTDFILGQVTIISLNQRHTFVLHDYILTVSQLTDIVNLTDVSHLQQSNLFDYQPQNYL